MCRCCAPRGPRSPRPRTSSEDRWAGAAQLLTRPTAEPPTNPGESVARSARVRGDRAPLLRAWRVGDHGLPVVVVEQVVVEAKAGELSAQDGRGPDQPQPAAVPERATIGGPDAADPRTVAVGDTGGVDHPHVPINEEQRGDRVMKQMD